MKREVLRGDEAVALGSIHAGLSGGGGGILASFVVVKAMSRIYTRPFPGKARKTRLAFRISDVQILR